MCRLQRSQHAKLVTFWICHNDPCDISLTDVNPDGPEFLKAMDLCFLIVRTKVEVYAVLSPLLLAAGH